MYKKYTRKFCEAQKGRSRRPESWRNGNHTVDHAATAIAIAEL